MIDMNDDEMFARDRLFKFLICYVYCYVKGSSANFASNIKRI